MDDPFDLATMSAPEPMAADQAATAPYLAQLNEAQRAAAEALAGPVLVLAGAGTGKTRVLITRLAHILFSRRAWPSQILAVTFTNKAAREMRERVERTVGGAVEGLWLGTFHSVGVRILRRHAELVGLERNFAILDRDDQERLLKQLLEAANVDIKKSPPRTLAAIIDRWKNQGLNPDKVPAGDGGEFADGKAVELYAAYQARLKVLNACDFGDLLLLCLNLFTANPDVLAEYQRRFRYILVDEYQDTNVAQYLWLRLLAREHHNICCVGDDDQSIYGWRGAEVGNILRFEADFPGAKVIRLERNYRSTPHILGAASGIIAHNDDRLGKTLWTDLNDGEKVAVTGLWDGAEEARVVAEEIETLQRAEHRLDQVAILVRAGFQTREFEERFMVLGMPYRVIGGVKFYERQEIRDALAYLRVLAQPDDDLAFERIVNVPKRGLGSVTLQKLHIAARAANISLVRATRRLLETDELPSRPRTTLGRLLADFDRWRGLIGVMAHTELTQLMLDESGYTEMWQNDKSANGPGRLENLKELVRAMAEFENLGGFLEHVALVMDTDDNDDTDKVNLMTLHAAKGLEFDAVFLPGWEEGLFPHQRALNEDPVAGLEEERRLAYVGLTRARRRCYISHAANRRMFGSWQASVPSRFVGELPDEHVERRAEQGVYNGAGGGTGTGQGSFAYDAPWLAADHRLGARGYQGGGYHHRDKTIDGTAREVREIGAPGGFAAGNRVYHQKFGYGTIKRLDGNKLEIAFDKAGRKKVIDAFVDPA